MHTAVGSVSPTVEVVDVLWPVARRVLSLEVSATRTEVVSGAGREAALMRPVVVASALNTASNSSS